MPHSPTDAVFVRGLEFEGNHGYYEEERKAPRRFRANIELSANLREASLSDALGDTVDYFQICQVVVKIGTGQTFKLLERLAGCIADTIQDESPASSVTVEIEKLGPPCPGVPQCCGVRIHRPARAI
ncbi:MAG: dihydroneopterin aldolase [Myxococcales bacterium]|nr:dihydroneopterin aldolase [Myxococcales bacterium]